MFLITMINNVDTLLLTWTIAPSEKVKASGDIKYNSTSLSPSKREREYYEAIKYYLEESKFSSIVFCDNSNYSFSYGNQLKSIAKSLWKNLELLKFQGDVNLVTSISYWLGEAEILDYVFEHSILLHKTDCWYKITWRYIVSNIDDIIESLNDQECYFQKFYFRPNMFNVNSATFKISNKLFEKFLYKKIVDVWGNNENLYLNLEDYIYSLLRDFLLNNYKTKVYLIIKYSNKRLMFRNIYKILVKIWFFDFNIINKMIDRLFYCRKINY